MCAAVCSTNALIVGDADSVSAIKRARDAAKGKGPMTPYGWDVAYK
jgi:formate dehydrogenase iron-sulfur subunit